MLITDTSFSSSLTNKQYYTQSYENHSCKTTNIVYGIECSICGLVYVGETKGQLNTRMNGHRYNVNNNGQQLLYQHFNQADHSILSMKVRILEKIYHKTNNPTLSTPLRRQREEYWIKELGCATPYGCNDKIDSLGNLSSPGCDSVNVLNLFNKSIRRPRSHGHRRYNSPTIHNVSFDSLLPLLQKPLGLHHIRTALFSIPRSSLHRLQQHCLLKTSTNQSSPEYRLSAIILDISHNVLFKPVRTGHSQQTENRRFLKLNFTNKGIDTINVGNILNHKQVRDKIPPYFKNQESPCISYKYNKSVASKLFNYKVSLKELDIDSVRHLQCSCSSSKFKYAPCGHIVTGDPNLIENSKLRDLITKGPKFRENKSFTWKQNFESIMNSVENFARAWAKTEDSDVNTLSEWVKSIRKLVKQRIGRLRRVMSTKYDSIFKDPNVSAELTDIHDRFVLTPADKASNNIVFVCKKYYYECLIRELGLNNPSKNPTYTATTLSQSEILDNHNSVLLSFGIKVNTDTSTTELPYLYWIPKLHKTPYKQRYIAGSSRCSTKPLSVLLTKILTTVKEGLQSYCATAFSRSGVNQMWILKNSKELVENLHSPHFSSVHSVRSYDFSTLYTTIPHAKLKFRLSDIIKGAFFHKNGRRRYKYLVIHPLGNYFVRDHTDSTNKYTEDDIIQMLNFLIDNIFVVFGGRVFQQTIGIPMGTNCAPLLADLFLYSYEAEFIQKLLTNKQKKLAASFNFTFRYIDDVLSMNNDAFHHHLHDIYPPELEIKETTESLTSASYLDLLLTVSNGILSTKLYDKRDDFDFRIVNFPFISSNIPESPAYGVYISQLIRYARACTFYNDFISRANTLTAKLKEQGYERDKLKVFSRKFFGRYNDLISSYRVSLTQFLSDLDL